LDLAIHFESSARNSRDRSFGRHAFRQNWSAVRVMATMAFVELTLFKPWIRAIGNEFYPCF
jgi:hypothetical protein